VSRKPERPWARHYQHAWEERSGDPNLPDWLRVAALAYGKHAANGHAVFGPGDLALVLGRVDPTTGEISRNDNVSRAIVTAVKHGWLAKGSKARCLIVPAFAVTGGLGSEFARCAIHVTQ
jgi:hypothetical protein